MLHNVYMTNTETKSKNLQPKKFAAPLIIVIIFLLLVTLLLNSQTKKPQDTSKTTSTPSPTSALSPFAESVLSLRPNPLSLDAGGKGLINVDLETNTNEVTAIQLELQYDPKAIRNVSIKPGLFFSNPIELRKIIDSVNGRITYMLGISPTQDPLTGSGTVAQISFAKVPNTALTETEMKFSQTELSESIVTATGVDLSVLKNTNNIKILLYQ